MVEDIRVPRENHPGQAIKLRSSPVSPGIEQITLVKRLCTTWPL